MTSTHAAALASTLDSLTLFRDTITGLPDAAMDFRPVDGTNSIAALAVHSITATRYLFKCSAGQAEPLADYRAGERAESFRAAGLTTAGVLETIEAFIPEAERILAAGREEHLATPYEFPEDPTFNRTGALFLVHACSHLREHVGQVELVRDLWLAQAGK